MDRDCVCIQELLDQALQQEAENLTVEQRENLQKISEDAISMLFKLHDRENCTEIEKAEEQLSSCVDSEVLELYQQVCSADLRVKQLRDEVPAALTKAIQDHLVACRPAALEAALTSAGAAKPTGSAGTTVDPLEDSGTSEGELAELGSIPDLKPWRQLQDVSNKVPAVMARLDQTLQRLTRIVDITEADQNRPSPRTVEKALLNRGGGENAADSADCQGGGDDIGAATTRKRLAFGLGA